MGCLSEPTSPTSDPVTTHSVTVTPCGLQVPYPSLQSPTLHQYTHPDTRNTGRANAGLRQYGACPLRQGRDTPLTGYVPQPQTGVRARIVRSAARPMRAYLGGATGERRVTAIRRSIRRPLRRLHRTAPALPQHPVANPEQCIGTCARFARISATRPAGVGIPANQARKRAPVPRSTNRVALS